METGAGTRPPDRPTEEEEELLAADLYPGALTARFDVFDDFLARDEAEAMRAAIDTHFSEPHKQRDDSFVWNYWYVPGLYTYLRADPQMVIPLDLVTGFHDALTRWAGGTLGLAEVTWPMLSLYVPGCGQGIHNDSHNGRFGYVYSLTRDDRRGFGGETIIFKEADPYRSRLSKADAGIGLYDLVAPLFNRLVLFDDRIPHGVQRIEGSMDPADARIVLHGHIREAGPILEGPLPARIFEAALKAALEAALGAFPESFSLHHGPLTVRLEIAPHGRVSESRVLLHRVARSDGGSADALVDALVEHLAAARYPPAAAGTVAILPIPVGGLLPQPTGLVSD
ncbi:MAG TPA: hypothetical protein VEX35_11905 [Allosphingosinicella sp.]|nr:hypothetical protein [Allosphingosinicella sp.]